MKTRQYRPEKFGLKMSWEWSKKDQVITVMTFARV